MKKIICLLSVLFLGLGAQEAIINKNDAVVTVNGAKITKEELERAVEAYIPKNYIHGSVTGKKRKEAEEKALAELIEKELYFQEAKRLGVEVEQNELDEYREKVIKFFGSRSNFAEALKRANMTEKAFFDIFKKDQIVQKFKTKYFNVSYSDEVIKKYYDENREKFVEPGKMKVRMIFVQIDPSDVNGTAKAMAKVNEAYAKLQSGEKFADVAYKYSSDKSRVMGGDIGYLHKGMLEPDVEKAIEHLEIGALSEIIRNVKGFAILTVEERTPQRQLRYEEIADKLKKERALSERKKRQQETLERLQNQANIVYR